MLYEIDSFGYTWGYITENWTVMSKVDLHQDKRLRKEMKRVEYDVWKRHNIIELKERWDNYETNYCDSFERFCKMKYRKNNS